MRQRPDGAGEWDGRHAGPEPGTYAEPVSVLSTPEVGVSSSPDVVPGKAADAPGAGLALLLRAALVPGSRLQVEGQELAVERFFESSPQHLVVRARDRLGRLRAVHLLGEPEPGGGGLARLAEDAAALEGATQLAAFHSAGLVPVPLPGDGTWVCGAVVEEWVEGPTLADLLSCRPPQMTGTRLLALMRDVANAIGALRALGLEHGGVSAANLVLWTPPRGGLTDSGRFRLVDCTGLGRRRPDWRQGLVGDHEPVEDRDWLGFVEVLLQAHNALVDTKPLSARDLRLLRELDVLLPALLDDEPGLGLADPATLVQALESADERAARPSDPSREGGRPFEFVSAEHIVSNRTFVALFADSCPWLDRVDGPAPVVLRGPRGCGKSMLLRWLSLRTHLYDPDMRPPDRSTVGFYVSCSSDLQNRIGWIADDEAPRLRREIVHFFNMLVAREVVDTLRLVSDRADAQSLFGLGPEQERALHEFVAASLQVQTRSLGSWQRLRQCLELIDAAMQECHSAMRRGQTLPWTTSETFLADLSRLLTGRVAYFSTRRITYLVDDYSDHRLKPAVQRVLNRVLWERTPAHVFKIGTEKYGSTGVDEANAMIDVGRELVVVDAGSEYLALNESGQTKRLRDFADDLLARRLQWGGYEATPSQLLGTSDWSPYRSLGQALRARRTDRPGGRPGYYHGLECIADLCTGDVHSLLLVYQRILDRGAVALDQVVPVDKPTQHAAIVSVSRELLEQVRVTYPHGPRLYAIATEFGAHVRRVLDDAPKIKKGGGQVPPMCPRIEVEGLWGGLQDALSAEEYDVASWLVRRAVFVELDAGSARHGNVQTLRWQLRRVYLPAFGAALQKNDAEKWDEAAFRSFLRDPHAQLTRAWASRTRGRRARADASQQELFPADGASDARPASAGAAVADGG